MQIGDLVRDMAMIPGLAGHEERVARYMRNAMVPFVDEISVDHAGNLIAKVNGAEADALKVMIFAHMDQLGFVVRKLEPDGFLRLERLGGIPEKVLPGARLIVEAEDGSLIPGMIGIKAHHATPPEEKYVVTPYQHLYVDVGARSDRELREWGIEVGCPAVYSPHFETLHNGRLSGTSIDDRAGCAVLVKLAELAKAKRPPMTLYLVGSVQEEFNLRGAMVAAAALQPDIAVSLDLMVASDTPDLKERSDLRLGAGPVLGMYSFHGRGTLNGTLPHPALVRRVKEVAAREGIPLQRSAAIGVLTDSSYVQLVGTGIPAVDLGFAARYTHTPVEVCDLTDLERLNALVWSLVSSLEPGFSLARE